MSDPKIVIFDLEIIPDLKKALKVWTQIGNFPGLTLRASITSILCAGYKIYGESKTHCLNAWDYGSWKRDVNADKQLCLDLRAVLEGVDAVVTQNGKRFDWRYLQTRLMKHGIAPLPKIKHIDTKVVAKREMFLFSNSLNHMSEFFLEEKKLEHEGWDLWVNCYNKEKKALNKMQKYCKKDVQLTERNFVKLKPFLNNNEIPNYNLYSDHDKMCCPICGSTRLLSNGWRETSTRRYRRLKCRDCKCSNIRTDFHEKNPRAI